MASPQSSASPVQSLRGFLAPLSPWQKVVAILGILSMVGGMLSWYAAFSLLQAALSAVAVVIGVLLVALASAEASGKRTGQLAKASSAAEGRQSAG